MADTSEGLKIYVAGSWTHREVSRDFATLLELHGHTITHKWWDCEGEYDSPEVMQHHAELDFQGVIDADVFVSIMTAKSEGKATELGMALYRDIPIVAIGKRGEFTMNIFHFLPQVHWCDQFHEAVEYINERDWR